MIVLDTNVISELDKPRPISSVLKWFADQDPSELHLSEVTLMELSYGAEKYMLKRGSGRYHVLLKRLMINQFHGRIVRSSQESFLLAGLSRARREMRGRAITVQDAQVAAICLSHGAILANATQKTSRGLI